MNQSITSYRIGVPLWSVDEHLDELLEMLSTHADTIREVSLFTSEAHAPLPLNTLKERVDGMRRVLPRFRALGMTAGINHMCTMGHHVEDLAHSLQEPWQLLVGPDGNVCRGSYCISDPRMREYVEESYVHIASAESDFIWLDDDIRLWGHMPLLCGCFCDLCLEEFNEVTRDSWTRDALIAAFGAPDTALPVRKAWLEHNRRYIDRVLACAERGAHRVDGRLPLGFMTGDRFFEGYDWPRWAATLAGDEKATVKWRPGGSFWDERIPSEMIAKAHAVGRQVAMLPEYVTDVQSEIENFPYQKPRKSCTMTALEAAVYIAAGSTGTAFNVLSWQKGVRREYQPYMDANAAMQPFYNLVSSSCARTPCHGIWTAWNQDSFSVERLRGAWFDGSGKFSDALDEGAIYELGLPPAYTREGACATILAGDQPLAFNEDDVLEMLRGGVMLDGQALAHLNDMGLGEHTGFKIHAHRDDDSLEVLDEHPLNGEFAGAVRDGRQSFKFWWAQPAYLLEPTADDAEPLAHIVDYARTEQGTSAGVFANALGGRVAVCGYYPLTMAQDLPKATQLKALFRWLSGDTLPAYVRSFDRVNMWCRPVDGGGFGVFLINTGFDPIVTLELVVRTDRDGLSVFDTHGNVQEIHKCGDAGAGYAVFEIADLPPWSAVFVK